MTFPIRPIAPVIVIFIVASLATLHFYREDKPAIINPLGFSNSCFAEVAQLVAHPTCNRAVRGSIPLFGPNNSINDLR